jgi:hypothetical protein
MRGGDSFGPTAARDNMPFVGHRTQLQVRLDGMKAAAQNRAGSWLNERRPSVAQGEIAPHRERF